MSVCVCTYMCTFTCHSTSVVRGTLQELVLSFHHVNLRNLTQVFRFVGKCLSQTLFFFFWDRVSHWSWRLPSRLAGLWADHWVCIWMIMSNYAQILDWIKRRNLVEHKHSWPSASWPKDAMHAVPISVTVLPGCAPLTVHPRPASQNKSFLLHTIFVMIFNYSSRKVAENHVLYTSYMCICLIYVSYHSWTFTWRALS